MQPSRKLGLFPELEIVNINGMQTQQSLCIMTEVIISDKNVLTTKTRV